MCVIKFLGRVGAVLGRRFAGAEGGSRLSQIRLHMRYQRVCAAEHPPRDPCHVLERLHGLAEIVERGAVVFAPAAPSTSSSTPTRARATRRRGIAARTGYTYATGSTSETSPWPPSYSPRPPPTKSSPR